MKSFTVTESCDIILNGDRYRLDKGDRIMVEQADNLRDMSPNVTMKGTITFTHDETGEQVTPPGEAWLGVHPEGMDRAGIVVYVDTGDGIYWFGVPNWGWVRLADHEVKWMNKRG